MYVEIWFLCCWRKFFKCTNQTTPCSVFYDTVSKNWFWARFSDNQVSEYPKDSLSSPIAPDEEKIVKEVEGHFQEQFENFAIDGSRQNEGKKEGEKVCVCSGLKSEK